MLENFTNENQTAVNMEKTAPDHAQIIVQIKLYSESKSFNLIIGCDGNVHHHQWGSSDTNDQIKFLFDYFLSTK